MIEIRGIPHRVFENDDDRFHLSHTFVVSLLGSHETLLPTDDGGRIDIHGRRCDMLVLTVTDGSGGQACVTLSLAEVEELIEELVKTAVLEAALTDYEQRPFEDIVAPDTEFFTP